MDLAVNPLEAVEDQYLSGRRRQAVDDFSAGALKFPVASSDLSGLLKLRVQASTVGQREAAEHRTALAKLQASGFRDLEDPALASEFRRKAMDEGYQDAWVDITVNSAIADFLTPSPSLIDRALGLAGLSQRAIKVGNEAYRALLRSLDGDVPIAKREAFLLEFTPSRANQEHRFRTMARTFYDDGVKAAIAQTRVLFEIVEPSDAPQAKYVANLSQATRLNSEIFSASVDRAMKQVPGGKKGRRAARAALDSGDESKSPFVVLDDSKEVLEIATLVDTLATKAEQVAAQRPDSLARIDNAIDLRLLALEEVMAQLPYADEVDELVQALGTGEAIHEHPRVVRAMVAERAFQVRRESGIASTEHLLGAPVEEALTGSLKRSFAALDSNAVTPAHNLGMA